MSATRVAEDKTAEPAVVSPFEETELGGAAQSALGVRGEAEDVTHALGGKAVGDMEDGEGGQGETEPCINW